MGTSKYVSDVKTVNQNHQIVFTFLSNFNNLGQFFNEYTLSQIAQQIPNASIDNFQSDADSCNFTISKIGLVGMRIIDREPTKTIKISGEGNIPFQLFLWIQILPAGAYQSKIRLTLHADLNMMMKIMANKKIKDGINKLAEALTMLPYQ